MRKDNFQVVPGQIIDGINLQYISNGGDALITTEKLIGKSEKPLCLDIIHDFHLV